MTRKVFRKTIFRIVIVILFLVQIYPVVWLVLASFRDNNDLATDPFGLSFRFTLENYINVMENSRIFLYLKNSAFIAVISLAFIVVLCSACAFALSVMDFKLRKKIFSYFMAGITIPAFVAVIPLYLIYAKTGIIDTRLSVIITLIAFNLPVNILLFVNFFKYIPHEIMEAAIMDGCSIYQIYMRIYMPLSLNTVVTVLAMAFIGIWNDYLFSMLFINGTSLKTITLGIQDFIGDYGYRNWGAIFASITITTLPTVLVYFALNNKVTSGMTLGATKG